MVLQDSAVTTNKLILLSSSLMSLHRHLNCVFEVNLIGFIIVDDSVLVYICVMGFGSPIADLNIQG